MSIQVFLVTEELLTPCNHKTDDILLSWHTIETIQRIRRANLKDVFVRNLWRAHAFSTGSDCGSDFDRVWWIFVSRNTRARWVVLIRYTHVLQTRAYDENVYSWGKVDYTYCDPNKYIEFTIVYGSWTIHRCWLILS